MVQKAIDVAEPETQALLCQELRGHVMVRTHARHTHRDVPDLVCLSPQECVKDQNGNHVIQKCIEKVRLSAACIIARNAPLVVTVFI